MERLHNNVNLILHVVEVLNGEDHFVKEFAIKDMAASGMVVDQYTHGCAYQLEKKWDGLQCRSCVLDGSHWETRKCDLPPVTVDAWNSQAAEQLWSRLNELHFVTAYARARYRMFVRKYFCWRNNFLRPSMLVNVGPNVSHRQFDRMR